MAVVRYIKAVNLSQLHDEILAAVPAFLTQGRVEGNTVEVQITVPDGVDLAAVAAVVGAHVPRAPVVPPAPTAAQLADIRTLADPAIVAGPAQVTAAVRALAVLARNRLGA